MKYCNKCRVKIDSPVEHCPLCYAALVPHDGEPELQAYPSLAQNAERYNLIFRMLLLFSLTAAVICFTINLLTFRRYWWSLIVISNIAYMWVAIGTALKRRSKPGFIVLVQALSLSVLMVIIDRFAGTGKWALNYAVPLCLITAALSITIIIIVKRIQYREFLLYFVLVALLGFLPVVLMAFGIVTVLWPSLVSALYAGLSLFGIFILADNAIKIELRKRFHF